MIDKLVPAHLSGRNFQTLMDPRATMDLKDVPVGGYVRISTQKEGQLTSIENQKKQIAEWSEVNNYLLKGFYVDMRSGEYAYTRDDVQRLLSDLKSGLIRGVITKEISRTSRDIMDLLDLKRKIVSYGGFLIAIKEGYDSRTDDDEFLLIIHAGMAQKERKTTANRVKVTQLIKAKEGKTNVPDPAYGYKLSEDRQNLVPNADTVPTYKLIIEKYLEGWGQLKIAKHLNEQGIPSKRGKEWCSNAIRTILVNPVYLGTTIYNTTTLIRDAEGRQKRVMRPETEWVIRENTHEPLITREKFDKVQELMEKKREKDTKEWSCDRKYLGSSILRCSDCGGKIYGSRYPIKVYGEKVEGHYKYKYCCTGKNGKCPGKMKYWAMEEVDNLIISFFKGLFQDKKKLKERLTQLYNSEEVTERFERELEELQKKLDKLDKAMKKQLMAFEDEVITMYEYKTRLAELRTDRDSALHRMARVKDNIKSQSTLGEKLNNVFNAVEQKLRVLEDMDHSEKVSFISNTFEAIYLNSNNEVTDVTFKLL